MGGRGYDQAGDRRRILIVADAGHVGAPELVEAVRRHAAASPMFELVLADPAGHAEVTDRQRRESPIDEMILALAPTA